MGDIVETITRVIARGDNVTRVVKRDENVTRVVARAIPGRDGAVTGSLPWSSITGKPTTFPGDGYTHTQSVPDTTWLVTHNLGRFPSVTVIDSAGTQVVGDTIHVSNMVVRLEFSAAFSGSAYLI